MKQNCILFLIISLFLFSCDDDDRVTFETNLHVIVPVEVSESSATKQESGKTKYSFTASKTYYLEDSDDLKDYMDNVTYIFSKGFSAQITGLAEGDTINGVTVSIGESIVEITQPESANPLEHGGFVYAVFGKELMEEKQVTVTVEGTTNKAPMNFDVNMDLLIEITADKQ
jgi:hypothetical protein